MHEELLSDHEDEEFDEPTDDEEEQEVKSIEKPIEKIIFMAEFTGGYIVRQYFEFCDKLIIPGIPFYFKEKEITIRTGTSGGTKNSRRLISNVDIDTDDIIAYYLNMDLVNIPGDDDSESCYVEQFNIDWVKTFLRNIGKSGRVKFHKTTASDTVHVTIHSEAVVKTGVKSSKPTMIEYDVSAFDGWSDTPNIKISMSQFCDSMKGMFRGKSGHTCFRVFPKGLYLESCAGNGSISKRGHYGDIIEDPDEDDYCEINVNTSVMKALQKINGMCYNSIVKVSSEANGYILLSHRVGDFGRHNIYLIDS